MGKRIKWRVYVNIPGKCEGCGEIKWDYVTCTFDPVGYKNSFPMLRLKFEEATLSRGVKIVG